MNWVLRQPFRIPLQMIFRNLFLFVLLPLLALYPVFSFYNLAYSAEENLIIFAILALCNCICYLGESNTILLSKMSCLHHLKERFSNRSSLLEEGTLAVLFWPRSQSCFLVFYWTTIWSQFCWATGISNRDLVQFQPSWLHLSRVPCPHFGLVT